MKIKKKLNNKNGQIAIFTVLFIALITVSYFGGHALGWWAFSFEIIEGTDEELPDPAIFDPPVYDPFDPYEDPQETEDPPNANDTDPYEPPYDPFDPYAADNDGETEIPEEKKPINFAYIAIAFVIVGAVIMKIRMKKPMKK